MKDEMKKEQQLFQNSDTEGIEYLGSLVQNIRRREIEKRAEQQESQLLRKKAGHV
jgi:hypothetical protein